MDHRGNATQARLPRGFSRLIGVEGQRGTTLIELMIGLVVLVVLTGIAMPMTSSILRQHHLRNGAEDLVFAADMARGRARSNRLAYGLFVGNGGLGTDVLKGRVVRGTGTRCATVEAATGPVAHSFDYSKNNPRGDPEVRINKKAPGDFAQGNAFVCFKPDGRVLNGATGMPFSAPSGTNFSAGDVFFELVRVTESGAKIGNMLQVQISYNGNAKVTFGHDLDKLK